MTGPFRGGRCCQVRGLYGGRENRETPRGTGPQRGERARSVSEGWRPPGVPRTPPRAEPAANVAPCPHRWPPLLAPRAREGIASDLADDADQDAEDLGVGVGADEDRVHG